MVCSTMGFMRLRNDAMDSSLPGDLLSSVSCIALFPPAHFLIKSTPPQAFLSTLLLPSFPDPAQFFPLHTPSIRDSGLQLKAWRGYFPALVGTVGVSYPCLLPRV